MRTVIATLVAPLVVVFALIPLNIFGVSTNLVGPGAVLTWVLVTYLIALAITICLAFPFRYASRRWHFPGVWVAPIVGFATGWLCLSAVRAFIGIHVGLEATGPVPVTSHLKAGGLGAICGLAFWLIAKTELSPDTLLERTRGK
jgi:hypothetical protein